MSLSKLQIFRALEVDNSSPTWISLKPVGFLHPTPSNWRSSVCDVATTQINPVSSCLRIKTAFLDRSESVLNPESAHLLLVHYPEPILGIPYQPERDEILHFFVGGSYETNKHLANNCSQRTRRHLKEHPKHPRPHHMRWANLVFFPRTWSRLSPLGVRGVFQGPW